MDKPEEKEFAEYSWLVCDFDDEDGECDTCEKMCNPTYYRRTSFEVDEGEYSCAECVRLEIASYKDIDWTKQYNELDP